MHYIFTIYGITLFSRYVIFEATRRREKKKDKSLHCEENASHLYHNKRSSKLKKLQITRHKSDTYMK